MHIKGLGVCLFILQGFVSPRPVVHLTAQQGLGWLSAQPVHSHGMQSNCKYWLSMNHVNLIPWKDTCKTTLGIHLFQWSCYFGLLLPLLSHSMYIFLRISLLLLQAHKVSNHYSVHQELPCLNPSNCLVGQLSPSPFTDGNNKASERWNIESKCTELTCYNVTVTCDITIIIKLIFHQR